MLTVADRGGQDGDAGHGPGRRDCSQGIREVRRETEESQRVGGGVDELNERLRFSKDAPDVRPEGITVVVGPTTIYSSL